MPDVLTNYGGNKALTAILRDGPHWLALHESDPTVLGLLATETAGGGYERQPIVYADPAAKTCVQTNPMTFAGMPGTVITHLADWDSPSGGNCLYAKELAAHITVPPSGQVLISAHDVALTLGT